MKIQVNLSFDTDDLESFDANMRRLSQMIDRLLGAPVEVGQETMNGIEQGISTPVPALAPAPVADEPRDAIVWTLPLRDVATRLSAGHTSWRKLDRVTRQELAINVIRNLIAGGYCTMPEFDRRRPSWMPKAISLAMSFGLKWTELVDLALPGKVSHVAPPIVSASTAVQASPLPTTSASTSVARVSAAHVHKASTNGGNGHEKKGGYL